jgi:hypothetical protein
MVNVEDVMVAGFMSSENETDTEDSAGTCMAPGDGEREIIVGGVLSMV